MGLIYHSRSEFKHAGALRSTSSAASSGVWAHQSRPLRAGHMGWRCDAAAKVCRKAGAQAEAPQRVPGSKYPCYLSETRDGSYGRRRGARLADSMAEQGLTLAKMGRYLLRGYTISVACPALLTRLHPEMDLLRSSTFRPSSASPSALQTYPREAVSIFLKYYAS